MQTSINRLIEKEESLTAMFDSDGRVAMAILEYLRNSKKELKDTDREVILQVMNDSQRTDFYVKYESGEHYYDLNLKD